MKFTLPKPYLTFQVLFALLFSFSLQAQCPGCIVNPTCSVPGGGLCPDSLPAAVVGNPYSQDVTFYVPPTIDASSFSGGLLGVVPLLEMRIDAISGLPFGLNWECNNPSNSCTYFPSQNDTLGCVRICGVPLGNPGVYNLTIFVTATVNAGILGNQTSQTSFASQMVLLPDTSNNQGFSMAPSLGCAPLQVAFTNNYPSNNYQPIPGQTQGFVYNWDFGNGLQSNAENPPPVTYQQSGDFPVNFSVQVDTFGFVLTNVTLSAVACTDFLSNPDVYILIYDGSNNLVHSTINNPVTLDGGVLPLAFPLSIQATNPPYRIEVWDDDSGLFGSPDDNCYNGNETPHPLVPLPLPPVNSVGSTVQAFVNPGTQLSFTFTYTKNVFSFNVADTVRVFPRPPQSEYTVSPAAEICAPDSALLTLPSGFGYEWFLNDTSLITGATGNALWVKTGGKYTTRMFDLQTGCDRFSFDTVIVVGDAIPQNFSLGSDGTTLSSNLTGGNYTYQWKFWNGAAFLDIPAPEGTAPTYNPPVDGLYALEVFTSANCSAIETINFQAGTSTGTETLPAVQMLLYPNPANGSQVFVSLSNLSSSSAVIGVSDLQGRVIRSFNIESANDESTHALDIQDIPAGIYVVELNTGSIRVPLRLVITK
jgi:hypothetical protein